MCSAAASPADRNAAAPEVCPICRGIGWLTTGAPCGHPDFAKLVACECKQAERERKRAEDLERMSNLAAFRDKTFASFRQFVPGVRHAFQRARAYACQPQGWLSLFGTYGCGKTHLAAAIANDLLARQVPMLFVVVPDLLDHLRSTFAPDSSVSYDDRFDAVKNAGLLVLDDLGTESSTTWAREKLYQLINHRYNQRLPTVFTSNVRLEHLDPRVASRLHDPDLHAEIITIQAADYRRRARNTADKES